MTGDATNAVIEFLDDGFDLVASGQGREEIRWERVREIVAYRREPGGADRMCLGFRVTASDEYIEVPETARGYAELLPRLYEAFPKIDRDWWKDIAAGLGSNRTTIHGLPLASQLQRDANQEFLLAVADGQVCRRRWKRRAFWLALVAGALLVVSLLQQGLAVVIEHNPSARWDDFLAITAGPLLLTIAVARTWPRPKLFFALLGGFYAAELLLVLIFGPIGPSLVGRLLAGKLQYVFVAGLEILAAMGVMLLPESRAAGQ
jgi:hypothetical protein